jgi:hypothetical protein
MPSLNHTLAAIAITTLHAYNLAANPRKPAQTLTRAKKTSRKFGLAIPKACGAFQFRG